MIGVLRSAVVWDGAVEGIAMPRLHLPKFTWKCCFDPSRNEVRHCASVDLLVSQLRRGGTLQGSILLSARTGAKKPHHHLRPRRANRRVYHAVHGSPWLP